MSPNLNRLLRSLRVEVNGSTHTPTIEQLITALQLLNGKKQVRGTKDDQTMVRAIINQHLL